MTFNEKTGSWLSRNHALQQEMTLLFSEHLLQSWYYAKCVHSHVYTFNPNQHQVPDQVQSQV